MTGPVAAEPVAPGLAHEPERTHDAAQERRSTAGRFDLQAKHRVNPPGDRYEQEADRVADAVVAERPVAPAGPLTVSPLIQRQAGDEEDEERKEEAEEVQARRAGADVGADLGNASPGKPLQPATRALLEPRFGRRLDRVRIHDGARAADLADRLGALAFTRGRDIYFGAGRYDPGSRFGLHLLAHEVTHTLQQGPARRGTVQRQPTSLGAVPEAERRAIQIQVIDIQVPAAKITAFFTIMPSGNPSESQTIGATDSFGTGIDAPLHRGLSSIAAWVASDTNALPLNGSVEVALDLSAHGGAHRRYRFTRFTHTTGRGRARTQTEVMLIEDVGAEAAVPQQATVPASVTIGSNSYPVAGTWTTAEFSALHQALTLLPPAAQTAANGLTFRRTAGAAPGAEAGHYDPETDVVELFDSAFTSRSVRLGAGGLPTRNIVHEIGHALDLRPLEAEWQRFNAAGQTAAARRRFVGQRSVSGSRFAIDRTTGDWNRVPSRDDRAPAFRAAVRRDGVRNDDTARTTPEGSTATLSGGPTTYSDTDYEEMFAEAFMLYVNDPARLEALRPATFAFFRGRYPRPAP